MNEALFHHYLTLGWIGLSVVIFLVLLFVSAPYGRHARSGWGPSVPARWGWLLMEAPASLVIAAFYVFAPRPPSLVAWVLLAVWQCHYLHRAFVYPFRLASTAKPLPLSVVLMAIFFNSVNGTINGRFLAVLGPGYDLSWLWDPRFVLGVVLFFGGLALNLHSDALLFNLRKPGETGYKIPRGGGYRWLSCPNYLGEVVEWSGWALACFSLPGLAFAVWTAANLVPRALTHHRWYRETFDEYPKERRAVIPFVL